MQETPKYLQVVELRESGLDRHAIAAATGIPVARVSWLLNYARKRGMKVARDSELRFRNRADDMNRRRANGSLGNIGHVSEAVAGLDVSDYEALLRRNKPGETIADTLVRLALETIRRADV